MPDAKPEPPIATLLRQAGYDLPAATLADLDRAHGLLQAMLARLPGTAAEAELATVFHPDAAR
ncbi:hypothetical protein [Falsiroseomonas oryzae]|uniref:hypothetical protein n=1 Tax=Falsiroseomonas oryzae TaxID=2766473 RepID=UPI0022EB9CFD|nr:hypothetical protein [Roseomonas sp. MO-31]